MAILEVKGIKKSFGSTEVLKGIDFSVEKGLRFRHTEHGASLILPLTDALDATSVYFGKVTSVIDNECDQSGNKSSVLKRREDRRIEKHPRNVKNDKELKHQRRSANDPNKGARQIT